jgi:ankyrin repeat protein
MPADRRGAWKDADVDERDADQTDADQTDANEPDDDVIELASRLFALARAGSTAELAAYIDAGVSVDLTNQSGDSLLMLAAYHGHAETVHALLGRNADPNATNDRGQTPLAGAVFKDELEVVIALVGAGADPSAGHPTALETAAMFGRQDLIDRLNQT